MVDITGNNGGKLHSMAKAAEGAVVTLLFRSLLSVVGIGLLALVSWDLTSNITTRENIVDLRGQVNAVSTKIDVQHDEAERRFSAIEAFMSKRSDTRDVQVNAIAMQAQRTSDKVDDLSDQLTGVRNDLKVSINDMSGRVSQVWASIARVQACVFGKGGPSCLLEPPR